MKNIMKATVLMLVLSIVCMTMGAHADEYTFFQNVVLSNTFPLVKARPVLVDYLLSVSVPSHWEAVPIPYENIMQYHWEGETSEATLYIVWFDEAEWPFEQMIEECKEVASVSCKADRSGFEWQAFEISEAIIVIHKGENGKNYSLLLEYEGKKPAPNSAVAHDFHCIVDSFKIADDLSVSLFEANNTSPIPAEDAAQFEDPVFEAMLLEAMGLDPDTPIPAKLLEKVTDIFIYRGRMSFYGFSDIAGLEQQVFQVSLADLKLFPNLTRMYVCDMTVTNLEMLYACSQLKALELIGCDLDSCEILKPLTQLESLSLARNNIVSLEPIANMTRLTFLNLYCNPVEDLSALSEMTQLQELLLSGTNIRTLEGLNGCTALEELTAQEIQGAVLSLKPLEKLENLSRIDFDNTSVCDRECISHVENVKLGSWW